MPRLFLGASIKGKYPSVVSFSLPHCAFDCIGPTNLDISVLWRKWNSMSLPFTSLWTPDTLLGDCIILRLSVFSSSSILDYGLKSSKMMEAHVALQLIGLHGMCPFHPSWVQVYQCCQMWSEWISRARLLGIMQPWLGSRVDKVTSAKLLTICRMV